MSHTFKSAEGESNPQLEQVLARLDSFVDWEKRDRGLPGRKMRVDLEPARDLWERLGRPAADRTWVHVAGTKGKGSVSSLVASGLRSAGLRTGLYASPHVESIRERIRIGEDWIEPEGLRTGLEAVLEAREAALGSGTPGAGSTWFDVLTVAAFQAFEAASLDACVVECGLGGRLDSTNIVTPRVAVLTTIALEHTAILGSTREAIAREKAGIIKPGLQVVSGLGGDPEVSGVLAEVCREQGAELHERTHRPGASIEERNRDLAGDVLDVLGRDHPGLGRGLLDEETCRRARLPGRCELRRDGSVPVLLDGAHVPASLELLLQDLEGDPGLTGPTQVILALGRDKDAEGLLKVLRGRADRVLCTSPGPGPYADPQDLLRLAERAGIAAETAADPGAAYDNALRRASTGGWILITGSLHLVGALRPRIPRNQGSTAC